MNKIEKNISFHYVIKNEIQKQKFFDQEKYLK